MSKLFDKHTLEQSEDLLNLAGKLQLAVAASRMGIWEYDEQAKCVHWDDRMLEIYGITDGRNERPNDDWERHVHPDDIECMIAYSEECIRNHTDFNHDYRIIREDGAVRHIRSLARNVSLAGNSVKLIGVNIDMTEDHQRAEDLKMAQRQLKHDARHDVLTGLGNRRRLDEVTMALFNQMGATDRYCAILLDLDHFKEVNDTLGHQAGDFVLKSVAKILSSAIGESGEAYRIGGDEFAVFFPTAPSETDITTLCQSLIETLAKPLSFEGDICATGASIGYAIGIGPPANPSDTFSNADAALYWVKRNGRNGFQAYHSDLRRKVACVTNARLDMLKAIENDELICQYQPQYDATTLEIVGAEALVRWECPDRGVIAPQDFLPQATQAGLSSRIDEHVLSIVARQQTLWSRDGIAFPTVSVNTSAERLRDPHLLRTMLATMDPHHKISFELLETAFLDDLDDVSRQNLEQLRTHGIRVELDNFGSGRSSVAALHAVKPDRVKMDRNLVAKIADQPQQTQTLQALASVARLQGAQVVLAGLESGIQLAAARHVDCDVLQGYALQRPMAAEDFTALLKQRT